MSYWVRTDSQYATAYHKTEEGRDFEVGQTGTERGDAESAEHDHTGEAVPAMAASRRRALTPEERQMVPITQMMA